MIIDASAVLAMLQTEPGGERVAAVIHESSISSVNWSEVIQKILKHDAAGATLCSGLLITGLKVIPFTDEQAAHTAELWLPTKHLGLSLADRACIQLGIRTGNTVLTTDSVWSKLNRDDLTVELIG